MHKHPVGVEGFDGSIEELAKSVCAMRYDKLAEFLMRCAEELRHQSNADLKRKRTKRSLKLTTAWGIMRAAQMQLEEIFFLCAPHMKKELGPDGAKLGYTDPWRDRNPGIPSPLP